MHSFETPTKSEVRLNDGYMVKTIDGYKSFLGVVKSHHESYIIIKYFDGTILRCSLSHLLFDDIIDDFIEAKNTRMGSITSGKVIASVRIVNEEIDLYDLLDVDGHSYLTNGILSHNCAFISDKGTLINSIVLEGIKYKEPVRAFGDLRIYVDSFAGRKIAFACDVSEGIGQDSHAIQMMDIDTFEQVGEFQNNFLTQTQYVKEIVKIVHMLFNEGAAEVYYTVEANSIGQGVMRLIENLDDPLFDQAQLISEPMSNRLGLLTTGKSKLSGCMDLKDAIELQKIKINSEILVTELKFFIRKGQSFAAEAGTHDDLVMAMVLLMNLLKQLANYEDNVYEMVNEIDDETGDELWGIAF